MNKPKIKQKLEQSFSLSPQQLIKANILQLNAIMLEARLYKELESNPALEIDQSDSDINTSQLDNINQDDETSIEDEENQDWDQKRDYDKSDFLSKFLSTCVSILLIKNDATDEMFSRSLKPFSFLISKP